jgi:acyl carrier protein
MDTKDKISGAESEFLATLSTVLEVDPSALTEQFTLAYGNWDSLTVMSTIAAIDQHFDVFVTPPELFECSSVKDLLGLVRIKLAQR